MRVGNVITISKHIKSILTLSITLHQNFTEPPAIFSACAFCLIDMELIQEVNFTTILVLHMQIELSFINATKLICLVFMHLCSLKKTGFVSQSNRIHAHKLS